MQTDARTGAINFPGRISTTGTSTALGQLTGSGDARAPVSSFPPTNAKTGAHSSESSGDR